jgi:DNA-binding MarR family transcriptional regulator
MVDRNDNPSERTVTAWARLVRVSLSLLRTVEADLKAQGYPPLSWYDALLELRRAGSKGLRPFELQREMLLAQYNMSRLTDRLLKAGYVARNVCDDDGRGQILSITPQGEAVLNNMWPVYRAAIEKRFSNRLTKMDVESLIAILGKLN